MGKYIPLMTTFGDLLCLNLVYAVMAGALYHCWSPLVCALLNVAFLRCIFSMYKLHIHRTIPTDKLLVNVVKNSTLLYVLFLSLLYIFDLEQGKLFLLWLYVAFVTVISVWTVVCKKTLWIYRSFGNNYLSTVVIGTGKTARDLVRQLQRDKGFGIRVEKLVDDGTSTRARMTGELMQEVIGIDQLDNYLAENNTDIIYFASDTMDPDCLHKIMKSAETNGLTLTYIVKLPKFIGNQFQPAMVAGMPAMAHTLSPLFGIRNKLLKRAFDLAVSVPFLIVSPLVFIPIAIGIKLTSPGPVFFRQKRTGLYGKDFVCLKFRTMKVNADSDKLQATKNDPRKTAFGNFLRKSSMDELPQFINVFLGNMSVVGPRPHMTSQTEDYRKLIDKYMIRHAVKPGITGLAQVKGFRGATEELWQMEKRVEYDVEYIMKWNIFLDIKIMFLTVYNAIHGEENAY